jgi:O-antigen/teichoic acid export membrane protein
VYGLGSVLVRGLAFLLLPLYTRYLSPAEYGLVALTVTCTIVLGMLYPLGLRGAISRTYYEGGTVEERKERVGTLWIAMVLSATVMAIAFDRLGPAVAAALLPDIPFHPYLRLAVWTAFLGVLGLTPMVLLQARERALAFVLLTLGAALTTTAIIVWFVVRGGGALGYLQGALIGAALAAIPYIALTLGQIRPVFRLSILLPALAFSLPLVPHALAGWALEMSDRAILTRFLPLHDVGVYSIGYQLGAAMGLATTAFNAAWVPFLFGTLKEEGEGAHPKVARLVTYYAIALCFLGLGGALMVEHAITIIAAPE